MNILVPIDFSKTSFAAYRYACHLAELFEDSELTLIHVSGGSLNTNGAFVVDAYITLENAIEERLDYFVEDYAKEHNISLPSVKVHKVLEFGIASHSITKYARKHDIDLIVMGTRDRHGIFDSLIGSTSRNVLNNTHLPVLLIHENTVFQSLDSTVFAFDTDRDIVNSLRAFKQLNNKIYSQVTFLNIGNTGKEYLLQVENIVRQLFSTEVPMFSYEVQGIDGSDVSTSIMDFTVQNKSDLLVLTHRTENTWKRLFERSTSIKIAQDFHLPVLVYPEFNQ